MSRLRSAALVSSLRNTRASVTKPVASHSAADEARWALLRHCGVLASSDLSRFSPARRV